MSFATNDDGLEEVEQRDEQDFEKYQKIKESLEEDKDREPFDPDDYLYDDNDSDDDASESESNPTVATSSWEKIKSLFASGEGETTQQAYREATLRLVADMKISTIEETDTIMRYDPDEGIYKDDGEKRIEERLSEKLEVQFGRQRANEILYRVRPETYESLDAFKPPEELVCVDNGVLDLTDPTNPELLDYSPKYNFMWKLDAPYKPEAEAEGFEHFLRDSVVERDIPKLQEYVGDALRHWEQPSSLCVILGPTDAGKGVFSRVVGELFGDDNVASKSLYELTEDRWSADKLHKKVVNIKSELSSESLKRPEIIKNYAGSGDAITAESKGDPTYEFVPTANHLFSTNQVPKVPDGDDAFYNRWLFVSFPDTVPQEDQKENLDEILIGTDEKKAGVLNWIIEGYARRHNRDGTGFVNERSIAAKEEQWNAYGDSIERFVIRCIDTDREEDIIPKADLYMTYKTMCDEVNLKVKEQSELSKRVNKIPAVGTTTPTQNSDKIDPIFDDAYRVRSLEGISLTEYGREMFERAMGGYVTEMDDSETVDNHVGEPF